LKSLGLDKPLFEPKEKPRKAKPETKKRKTPVEVERDPSEPAKIPRSDSASDTGVRRSSRNAGKKIDYNAEQQLRHSLPLSYSSGVKVTENTGPLGREDGIRKYDPYVFWLDTC
jgi:E3 ubiquitin-protein ligase UHRF1